VVQRHAKVFHFEIEWVATKRLWTVAVMANFCAHASGQLLRHERHSIQRHRAFQAGSITVDCDPCSLIAEQAELQLSG
jgi:hypothetical protein